ncbi:MAG: hypothetical protein WDA16_13985 [Candidatus Thermoplasmatota archaeon]
MPEPNKNEPQQPPSEARNLEEAIRYAPHLVFIKQLATLDEVMATGQDAWNAFDCWKSGIHAYARADPIFKIESKLIRAWTRKKQRRYAAIPRNMIINKWRPALIDVMRRAGMFPRMDEPGAAKKPDSATQGTSQGATRKSVNK